MNLSTLTKINKNFCNICDEKKLKNFFKISSLPYKTVNNFTYKDLNCKINKLFQTKYCNNCGVICLDNVVNFEDLYKSFKNYQKHSRFIKKEINKVINKSKKITLINIGKSKDLLNKRSLKNINYINFDPCLNREDNVNKKFSSLSKYFKKYKNKVDVILIDNFLSNIVNVSDTIKLLSKMLNPNGKILIYTHYGTSNLKKVDINRFYFEHVYYFSITSLLFLFKKFELYQSKIKFFEDKDFVFLVYQKQPMHINKELRNQIIEESEINKENYIKFTNIIKKNKKKLSSLINKNKFDIYGYGCSIGATSIIKAYRIENKILSFIDDKPLVNQVNFEKKSINVSKLNQIEFSNRKKLILNLIPRHNKNIISNIRSYMKKGDLYINMIRDLEIKKF